MTRRDAAGRESSPFCVTFDLDDTLYLERDYVRSGFDAVGLYVAERLRQRDFARRAWTLFEDGVRNRIFDEVLRSWGIEPAPDLIAELVECYRTHVPAIALADDARSCLERLHPLIRLAIVSDGPLESQRAKVRALGVDQMTHVVVLTAELGPTHAKPSHTAFALVEEGTGIDATGCVYVGDNPAKDFRGPKERGWRTVRIRRRGGLHEAAPSGTDVDVELTELWDFEVASMQVP